MVQAPSSHMLPRQRVQHKPPTITRLLQEEGLTISRRGISNCAKVHVPRNGVNRQESGFGVPVQGDCAVAELKAIMDAQMAGISLHTTTLLDL